MSKYLRDTAFVLLAEPYKEQDFWLTLYGERFGKLVGMIRGVRSAHSKQRGHVEPYSKIEVMIAKGAAYDKIAVAQTCASSQALRSSLAGMAIFGSAVAIVARSTESAVANERIFQLLDEMQMLLSGSETGRLSTERSALLLSSFILHFLEAEGYGIDFDQCRVCGTSFTKEAVWLSLDQGGVLCRTCVTRVPPSLTQGEWLSYPVLQTIRFLRREPFRSVLALSAPRSVLQESAMAVDRLTSLLPRSTEKSVHDFLFSLV
jgi:DNA repair protein RecO (recombination protein O)